MSHCLNSQTFLIVSLFANAAKVTEHVIDFVSFIMKNEQNPLGIINLIKTLMFIDVNFRKWFTATKLFF